MRIALIGANGQLGAELSRLLGGDAIPLVHADIEISDLEHVRSVLARVDPDCVINTAAYNLVDQAEDEPQAAYAANALGPRHLAICCGERDVPLLHVSTDFVFGLDTGRSKPFTEDDAPGPVSAYGTSKLAGEYFVRSLCSKHYVVRTCGLYGHRAVPPRKNFVETMLKLGETRDTLSVVDDQSCTPTSTADLAVALQALLQSNAYGLYHVTNGGETTWCHFARKIFELAKMNVDVKAISSAQFGAKAKRPGYSVLNTSKFRNATGHAPPNWDDALEAYLSSRRG